MSCIAELIARYKAVSLHGQKTEDDQTEISCVQEGTFSIKIKIKIEK
jgi:hypothetical protein